MLFKSILDSNFANFARGKNVILRADLNLPMQHGFVADKTRLINTIPTIKLLCELGCGVILISHFGRPDGKQDLKYSLKQILNDVKSELGNDVEFCDDVLKATEQCKNLKSGKILLLENLRFYPEEEKNDEHFAKQIASYGQVYVNDAFGCSHRKHASIHAITKFLPSYAGLLLSSEIKNTQMILDSKSEMSCLIGGSKISTKIELLKTLVTKAKTIAIGGGMANTFYFAMGHSVGKSLHEPDFKQTALEVIELAKKHSCNLILPQQVVVTDNFANPTKCKIKHISEISPEDMIVDIGFDSLLEIKNAISSSKIIVWNGPFGVFEKSPFNIGTESIARIISVLTQKYGAYSIVGGGDVVSALSKSFLTEQMSYISTGGGSFLEYLEKGSLPGVDVLKST